MTPNIVYFREEMMTAEETENKAKQEHAAFEWLMPAAVQHRTAIKGIPDACRQLGKNVAATRAGAIAMSNVRRQTKKKREMTDFDIGVGWQTKGNYGSWRCWAFNVYRNEGIGEMTQNQLGMVMITVLGFYFRIYVMDQSNKYRTMQDG